MPRGGKIASSLRTTWTSSAEAMSLNLKRTIWTIAMFGLWRTNGVMMVMELRFFDWMWNAVQRTAWGTTSDADMFVCIK